jgi:CRISPR-associated exonuclease Cas4
MMGDRDYRNTIKNAIDSIGRELEIEIDAKDFKTINLLEVVRCLRRSYYDRTDSKEIERRGFNDLLSGLLRKLEYGSEPKEFSIDDIKLKGHADMIVDDIIILFSPSQTIPESPQAEDLLYLNACLWIYDKIDGMIIYITSDKEEFTFSLTRDKKMFEEIIRRVRVLSDLLKEQKTPILEPSQNCLDCQYYQRCFISKKSSKQLSLGEMLGLSKEN